MRVFILGLVVGLAFGPLVFLKWSTGKWSGRPTTLIVKTCPPERSYDGMTVEQIWAASLPEPCKLYYSDGTVSWIDKDGAYRKERVVSQ